MHLSHFFLLLFRHSSALSWCGNCLFRRVSRVQTGPMMKAQQHHSNEFQHNGVQFILAGLYIIGYFAYFSSTMIHGTALWKKMSDASILLTGPMGTNIDYILIKSHQFSYKKCLKIVFAKWHKIKFQPLCCTQHRVLLGRVRTRFGTSCSYRTKEVCPSGLNTRLIYSTNRFPITIYLPRAQSNVLSSLAAKFMVTGAAYIGGLSQDCTNSSALTLLH